MNTPQKTTKLIAMYARVSTSHQEEEQTIENQMNAMKEYIEGKGYTVVRVYKDEGWSGDSLIRPALDRLRQDAKDKIWEGVLIYDPDRLARRYSYQELVSDELREAGIEVMYVTVSAPKNNEDKILHGVRGLFAEYERAKITERFRLGKLRKIKNGHILVSEPLYGYSYVPKNDKQHGYYEINEQEASVVRQIFSWVADEKMTLRGIVRRLQKENIKPRKSKRGVWSTSTLSTMLRNEAYIGEAHWGSSYAVIPEKPLKEEKYKKIKKSSRRIKPKEEWLIIPVPVIVGKDIFERTRAQLKRNFAQCKRNKKNDYLLSSLIYCECGRRRAGEGAMNGKHLYYRCTDRVHSFPLAPTCKEGGINARVSDKLVWEKISKLMTSPELLNKQIERWNRSQKTKTSGTIFNVESLETELNKLKKQEDRYNKAYGAGAFSVEQLKEYTSPLKQHISEVEIQIAETREQEKEQKISKLPSEADAKVFAERVKENINNLNFSSKREIVLSAVEKIVGTQEKLCVSGYIPVDNYVSFKTNHRNRWTP
ncbi:recombinase family protein [Candidatus Kaiserbacteria bacterium]|nr:recombinase family protein [Candidatus Kaiserbacteria bacterium]